MANFKLRVCKITGHQWKQYNSLQRCPCDFCIKEQKQNAKPKVIKPLKAKIAPISKKQSILLIQYSIDRKVFLEKPENRICPITGQPTTEVHHKKKRRGYADEWARQNNIPLLLDRRYWLAVSGEGHNQIENNPEWAFEHGYSIRNNSN